MPFLNFRYSQRLSQLGGKKGRSQSLSLILHQNINITLRATSEAKLWCGSDVTLRPFALKSYPPKTAEIPIVIHYTYMLDVVKMTLQNLVLFTNNSQKEGSTA